VITKRSEIVKGKVTWLTERGMRMGFGKIIRNRHMKGKGVEKVVTVDVFDR
jgi:hypothetical protein